MSFPWESIIGKTVSVDDLEGERQPCVIIRNYIFASAVEAQGAVDDVDDGNATAKVDSVDFEAYAAGCVQACRNVTMLAIGVEACHMANRNRISNAAFDKGTDGNMGKCKFQAGIDGYRVDVSLLHVLEQATVLAVARIILGTQSETGDIPDLVFSHASHTEVVRNLVHKDSTPIPNAKVANGMESELTLRSVDTGSFSRLGSYDGPLVGMTIAMMRWTKLCLRRNRQREEEAEG